LFILSIKKVGFLFTVGQILKYSDFFSFLLTNLYMQYFFLSIFTKIYAMNLKDNLKPMDWFNYLSLSCCLACINLQRTAKKNKNIRLLSLVLVMCFACFIFYSENLNFMYSIMLVHN